MEFFFGMKLKKAKKISVWDKYKKTLIDLTTKFWKIQREDTEKASECGKLTIILSKTSDNSTHVQKTKSGDYTKTRNETIR